MITCLEKDPSGRISTGETRLIQAIIRKMLYAFEEYQWCVGGCDFDNLPVEKQEKIKEGMQLFIDYYRDLWI